MVTCGLDARPITFTPAVTLLSSIASGLRIASIFNIGCEGKPEKLICPLRINKSCPKEA